MTWRLAESLDVLRDQVNGAFPGRSTASDGTIGDTRHAASVSDHNPNELGVVCALDLTHDPAHGADMGDVAEALRLSQDPRIKYVIFNGRMFSSYPTTGFAAFTWRPYSGLNPHDKHMHVSVHGDYDDATPWQIGGDMLSEEDLDKIRKMVREEVNRARKLIAVGSDDRNYRASDINLAAILEEVKK